MSRPTFIVPEVNLDRDAAVPVQKQIRGRIAAAIRNGSLAKGSKLPSSRMLAKLLQVSRGTVVAAYEELLAEGLIESHARSSVRVCGSNPAAGLSLVGLRAAVRAAQFPARVQPACDPDGNPLYLNVR